MNQCKHHYIAVMVLLTVSIVLVAQKLDAQPSAGGDIWQIDIDGVIGPANADFMVSNLQKAEANNAQLLLVQLNTPGGLDKSMRQMIQAILSASIPVVIYVAPSGARAASAGTYLLYASHIAAMAPATNLGAATPIQLGSPGLPELPDPQSDDQESQPHTQPATAMERKLVNDAVAYIQSLAELRQRNREWAEQAVRQGASLSANDALAKNVVDIVAKNQNALLEQLNNRSVTVNERTLKLNTENAEIIHVEPGWRINFLEFITNPNVAYILMLVGIYGLIFEFSNPGMGVPGLVGVVSVFLALYAFHVLPISYLGAALIIVGIALMVFEAFSPSFGIAGIGGVIIFILGSITLMDSDIPAFQIALPIILAVATVSAAMILIVLSMVIRATRRQVVSGKEALINHEGVVESIHKGVPMVRIGGELWQAQSESPLAPGNKVNIEAVGDLRLTVNKIDEE